jgi:hypothetical protein
MITDPQTVVLLLHQCLHAFSYQYDSALCYTIRARKNLASILAGNQGFVCL